MPSLPTFLFAAEHVFLQFLAIIESFTYFIYLIFLVSVTPQSVPHQLPTPLAQSRTQTNDHMLAKPMPNGHVGITPPTPPTPTQSEKKKKMKPRRGTNERNGGHNQKRLRSFPLPHVFEDTEDET